MALHERITELMFCHLLKEWMDPFPICRIHQLNFRIR